MKKLLLLSVVFVLGEIQAQVKDISGIWVGDLNVGITLKLVFHFNKTTEGSYQGTLDSPDQGANGIPCSRVQLTGDSVKVEINVIKGSYSGKLVNDSTLTGGWSQGPANVSLNLKKVERVLETVRPQTPKPPFSYNVEEVQYDNNDGTAHLAGTLTFPKSGGPFPAAVLISGSGQQDRDETIMGHKPFAIIADDLTKRGFAILRVDDRGTGKSTGDVKNASSADFAKDVQGSLAFLKRRGEIDKNKIGLIGHSEGGLIAALVGSGNKDIDFVVLLAGPGIKGTVLLSGQVKAALMSEGVPSEAADGYVRFYDKMMNTAINSPDSATAIKGSMKDYESWKKETTPEMRAAIGYTEDEKALQLVGGLIKTFRMPWFKYFLQSDPAPLFEKFSCKVLALNGEKDVQVLAKPNLEGIRSALQKSASKIYETKELPGLNHLFQTCSRCSVSEYSQLPESFSPLALEEMGTWLKKNVQR